ncbi:MAG: hypothetical protein ACREDR_40870, partial [Blastocatellia bacterium]
MTGPTSRKLAQALFLILSLCSFALAQGDKATEREAEWRAYKLPAAKFVRCIDEKKLVVFRRPADWTDNGKMAFAGPDGTTLRLIVEEVADGVPVSSYLAAVMQNLQNLPGAEESVVVR